MNDSGSVDEDRPYRRLGFESVHGRLDFSFLFPSFYHEGKHCEETSKFRTVSKTCCNNDLVSLVPCTVVASMQLS